jgi:hypothetical protein
MHSYFSELKTDILNVARSLIKTWVAAAISNNYLIMIPLPHGEL